MAATASSKTMMGIVIALLVAILGYFVLTTPDHRSFGTKVGDAVNELPNGVDKAARQMEDRTPAEKIGDAVDDAKHDTKKAINQQ
ncbi:MAG: hypothetical protein PW788_08215 [Micavibrio sp.]|nr:hypothetical protein [Micavibrio sp.]